VLCIFAVASRAAIRETTEDDVRRAKGQWFESPANCLQRSRSSPLFEALPARDRAAGAQRVPVDANARADCAHEKDLQMQVFPEAAEGIRTLDLLHGKQNLRRR
jgi:hypothetical protein